MNRATARYYLRRYKCRRWVEWLVLRLFPD